MAGDGLRMRYFVLKPSAKYRNDPYAIASRNAMLEYAKAIEGHDSSMSKALREWVEDEIKRDSILPGYGDFRGT